MSSGQYGGNVETEEETREKQMQLLRQLSMRDFVDFEKPWVLVKDGSLLGYFDWVPIRLRYGPWTPAASILIYLLIYAVMLVGAWLYNEPAVPHDWKEDSGGSYPEAFTDGLWWYNVVVFAWMTAMMVWIYRGPNSYKAWGTYTVQSWTIITVRHGLSALAPILRENHFLLTVLEYLRFPALVTASMTVTLWNLLVGPFIYFVGMKTPEAKTKFRTFFFSFRLTQLHVFNIVYAVMNCVVASPSRTLTIRDLYVTIVGMIGYVLFYLVLLDRIGVHLYPVFSPRTRWFILTFSMNLTAHFGWFYFWNNVTAENKWREFVLECLESR